MDPEAHRDHDRPNSPWTGSGRRSIWVGRARLHPLLLEATVGDDQPIRRLLDHDRVGGPICYVEATELDGLLRSDPNFDRSALRHGNVHAVVIQEVRVTSDRVQERSKKIHEPYVIAKTRSEPLLVEAHSRRPKDSSFRHCGNGTPLVTASLRLAGLFAPSLFPTLLVSLQG